MKPLHKYHRAITAEDFMQHLAPTNWPPGKRSGFCVGYPDKKDPGTLTCSVTEGTQT